MKSATLLRRANRLLAHWKPLLRLSSWAIDCRITDKVSVQSTLSDAAIAGTFWDTATKVAVIYFKKDVPWNLDIIDSLGDDTWSLESTVVHELLHIVAAEQRAGVPSILNIVDPYLRKGRSRTSVLGEMEEVVENFLNSLSVILCQMRTKEGEHGKKTGR